MNITTMDIAKRKDIIIFALIIILALLIGRNVVYKLNLNKIDSIKSQIELEEKKNLILGDISILNIKAQAYQKRFLASVEITGLLATISELGEKTGIKIENYNPLPVAYKDEYVELSVTVPLRCRYHQLGKFLSLIESNEEFIWVKQLVIKKPTVIDSREKRTPKVDLTLSGLYVKE